MRILSLFFFLILFGYQALADAAYTQYFFGEARRTFIGIEAPDDSEPLLLKRTVDPDNGTIVEFATFYQDNIKKMNDGTVTIKIKGTKLTLSDDTGYIQGTGYVRGKTGYWNFLFFDMTTRDGTRIEDENYVDLKKKRMIARKRMFSPEGQIFMLWDGEFKALTKNQYEKKYQELHSQDNSSKYKQ